MNEAFDSVLADLRQLAQQRPELGSALLRALRAVRDLDVHYVLRREFAEVLHNDLLLHAGEDEREALESLLADYLAEGVLKRADLLAIESKAGLLAAVMAEAGFLAGLECGRDISKLIFK